MRWIMPLLLVGLLAECTDASNDPGFEDADADADAASGDDAAGTDASHDNTAFSPAEPTTKRFEGGFAAAIGGPTPGVAFMTSALDEFTVQKQHLLIEMTGSYLGPGIALQVHPPSESWRVPSPEARLLVDAAESGEWVVLVGGEPVAADASWTIHVTASDTPLADYSAL